MFRNRQINYAKEFDYSIKLASVNEPHVNILRLFGRVPNHNGRLAAQIDYQAKAKAAEGAMQMPKSRQPYQSILTDQNKLAQMKRSYNLIT